MSGSQKELLVVLWEWSDGPHKGARFWGTHNTPGADGRIRDWPKENLRALGVAKVTVVEGEGLDLLTETDGDGTLQDTYRP